MTDTAGNAKRASVAAMMSAASAIGNIIGPQTFQTRNAPRCEPAKIPLEAWWSASLLLILVLAAYYHWINRRRDAHARHALPENDIGNRVSSRRLLASRSKLIYRLSACIVRVCRGRGAQGLIQLVGMIPSYLVRISRGTLTQLVGMIPSCLIYVVARDKVLMAHLQELRRLRMI